MIGSNPYSITIFRNLLIGSNPIMFTFLFGIKFAIFEFQLRFIKVKFVCSESR